MSVAVNKQWNSAAPLRLSKLKELNVSRYAADVSALGQA